MASSNQLPLPGLGLSKLAAVKARITQAEAWVKGRLSEPSTWAGIGVALTPLAAFDRTILWGAAACGTVAAILRG